MSTGDVPFRIPHSRGDATSTDFQLNAESSQAEASFAHLRRGGAMRGRATGISVTPAAPRQESVSAILSTAASTAAAQVATTSASTTAGGASNASKVAPAGTSQSTSTHPAAAPARSDLTGDDAVVQALKDALAAAGINYQNLNLTAHANVEGYPGGSYLNRYISVDTPGGSAGLMTDLVSIDPKVAVQDIKRMLNQVQFS